MMAVFDAYSFLPLLTQEKTGAGKSTGREQSGDDRPLHASLHTAFLTHREVKTLYKRIHQSRA